MLLQELPTYIAAKYEETGSVLPAVEWGNTENTTLKVTFETSFKNDKNEKPLKLSMPKLQLWKKTVHQRVNRKSCRYVVHGVWDSSREVCESFFQLTSLCVAMKNGDIGQGWILVGCAQDATFATYKQARGTWKSSAQAGLENMKPPEGPINLSGVQIEFRSAEDPFIVLQRVTEGKLNFGASPDEMRLRGLLLLLVGLFLLMPCCYHTCRDSMKAFVSPGDSADQEYSDLFDERDDL